jgi:hypothetical protein
VERAPVPGQQDLPIRLDGQCPDLAIVGIEPHHTAVAESGVGTAGGQVRADEAVERTTQERGARHHDAVVGQHPERLDVGAERDSGDLRLERAGALGSPRSARGEKRHGGHGNHSKPRVHF